MKFYYINYQVINSIFLDRMTRKKRARAQTRVQVQAPAIAKAQTLALVQALAIAIAKAQARVQALAIAKAQTPTKAKAREETPEIKSLVCDSCHHSITSEKHYLSCKSVLMYQIVESYVDSNFKPMMTFGLGGCTAIIIVFFNSGKCIKIVMGHHPYRDYIIQWYQKYKSDDYNIVIIIKSPGEYLKEDEKYIFKAKDENYYKDLIDCSRLIFEPYPELISFNESSFVRTLYFKINPQPSYSNMYGYFIEIVP